MRKTLRLVSILAGLAGLAAVSQAATLKVGDKAPKLQTGKWIQGEPVKDFEKDKTYIVEFWATWCGPCRVSIPHLNEIHNKFKDKGLVVIGQDCWENDEDEVPKFVKQMGSKMTYRVALDDKNGSKKGKMADTWMEAADQNGIPTAFIVSKTGEIAWIGHPMTLKEKTLEEILAGNFDVKKAAADSEKKKAQEEKVNAVFREFQKAAQAKDWTTAEAKLDETEKLLDEEDRGNIDNIRLRMSLQKGDMDKAETIAKKLADRNADDATYHNEIAWSLITQPGVSKGLTEIAEKEAMRANELSKGNDAGILDTVARVQFVKGDKEAAVATQKKAVAAAEGRTREQFQKTLDAYQAGKLPNE